jgi:hypothetical protein
MPDLWNKPYHVVIEVENKQCQMLAKLVSLGLRNLKVVDIRSSAKGVVRHLVELSPDQLKELPKDFKMAASKHKVEGKPTVWFESEGCEVCSKILSRDAFLVSGKSLDKDKITYSFLVPTLEAYTGIISALESAGFRVDVLRMGSFEPKAGVLTETQERVFWLALKGGFFDYPRKIDTLELAKKLGIRPSTLSEIIRRGTRRLLEHHFKKELSS